MAKVVKKSSKAMSTKQMKKTKGGGAAALERDRNQSLVAQTGVGDINARLGATGTKVPTIPPR